MTSKEKLKLEHTGDEQLFCGPIKQETDWLVEQSPATGLEDQVEEEVNMESLPSINTENHHSYSKPNAHVVQEFTPAPQTPADDYEGTKTELTSDEEFIDEKNDANSDFASPANNTRDLPLANDKHPRVSTPNSESQTSGPSACIQPKKHCERPYKCELCPRSFKTKYILKDHLDTHTEDRARKFPCQSCERAFYYKQDLKSHMKTHGNKTFKCEVCPRSYRKYRYLKDHLITHAKKRERKFPCQSCEKAFYKKSELTRHMLAHSGRTFICEVCGAGFTHKSNLGAHKRRLHRDVFIRTKLKLDEGQEATNISQQKQQTTIQLVEEPQATMKISVTQSKSDQHPKKSRADCERAYKCELCSRSFKTKYVLKAHLLTHTKDRERKFPCQSCESAFYTQSLLTKHMRTHSSETFNCELCGASYRQKGSLDDHVLRLHTDEFIRGNLLEGREGSVEGQHSALDIVEAQEARTNLSVNDSEAQQSHSKKNHADCERPHKCEFCPRSFREKFNLNVHLDTHAKDRERKFPCQLCERAFYYNYHLQSHMKLHSNAAFKCEVCSRIFRHKHNLKVHMKTHEKHRERKFPCQSCERAFYHKRDLKEHMRSHSRETIICEACGASFQHKRNLDFHMLRLHRDVFISTELQLDGEKQAADKAPDSHQRTPQLAEEPQDRMKISVSQSNASPQPKKGPANCERAYKCDLCPRSFRKKFDLTRHLNTHAEDKERKFRCQSCERAFYHKRDLTRHIKTHSGGTFNCEVCGASYKQKRSLDLHVLRRHSDEFIRNELILNGGEESDNDPLKSQQSIPELVEEQQPTGTISVSQSDAYDLCSDSHPRNLEAQLGKIQPTEHSRAADDFTNPKEEFISDEEFIEEQNSTDARKH